MGSAGEHGWEGPERRTAGLRRLLWRYELRDTVRELRDERAADRRSAEGEPGGAGAGEPRSRDDAS